MNHKNKFDVARYRAEAQENFFGADGWDSADGGWDYADGNPELNADGDPELNANGVHEMPEAPQINFTIVNSNTTASQTCVLFGSNIYLNTSVSNFGSGAGITITPDYSVAYSQVLRDTGSAPFTIGKVRMQSTNTAQVTQGLTVVSTNIYGESAQKPVSMITSISAYQQQLTIAESETSFDVTGNVYFSFPVLAGVTLTCTVYIQSKVNVARQLVNAPIAGAYRAPKTGLRPALINPARGGVRRSMPGMGHPKRLF